jgi:hypothetical protein
MIHSLSSILQTVLDESPGANRIKAQYLTGKVPRTAEMTLVSVHDSGATFTCPVHFRTDQEFVFWVLDAERYISSNGKPESIEGKESKTIEAKALVRKVIISSGESKEYLIDTEFSGNYRILNTTKTAGEYNAQKTSKPTIRGNQ